MSIAMWNCSRGESVIPSAASTGVQGPASSEYSQRRKAEAKEGAESKSESKSESSETKATADPKTATTESKAKKAETKGTKSASKSGD